MVKILFAAHEVLLNSCEDLFGSQLYNVLLRNSLISQFKLILDILLFLLSFFTFLSHGANEVVGCILLTLVLLVVCHCVNVAHICGNLGTSCHIIRPSVSLGFDLVESILACINWFSTKHLGTRFEHVSGSI